MKLSGFSKFAQTRGQRGFADPVGIALGIGGGIIGLVVLLYIAYTLATALNNSNVTTAVNGFGSMVVNFANQLGTVGTIMGVALLLFVVGGIGLYGYNTIKGRGGGSGM